MHIVTIDNFLVCCSLETGGYVLGYLGAISSVLGIVSLVGLVALLAVSYETIIDALKNEVEQIFVFLQDSQISEWL